MNKNIPICNILLAGVLSFAFSGAADAQAQMAQPLHFSPELMEILSADPTYRDMLKQFRDLVNSPAQEKLTANDFQTMALLAFQGVAENAVTTQDALDTIILMHKVCTDVRNRLQISNAAKDILRFRPRDYEFVREALVKMKDKEGDYNVRAYIAGVIEGIDKKYSRPPGPARPLSP